MATCDTAFDFPFAFTDHAACPAPPAGNTLPFPVTAGEPAPAVARS